MKQKQSFYVWSDTNTSVVRIDKELKKELKKITEEEKNKTKKITIMYLVNEAVKDYINKKNMKL